MVYSLYKTLLSHCGLDVLTHTLSINMRYDALYPQLHLSPVLIFKSLDPLLMCFRVPHNTDRMCQGLVAYNSSTNAVLVRSIFGSYKI